MTQAHQNGSYVANEKLKSCKRCNAPFLAWTQGSKSGKWYLCNTYPSQSDTKDIRWMATWSPHKCETR